MRCLVVPAAAAAALTCAAPAQAGEIFGGLYVHDVDTPLSISGVEDGVDLQLGWRSDPLLGALRLQPYAFLSLHSAGKTHFGVVGVSRTFGSKVYVRPGLGLAVHTGSAREHQLPGNDRIEFGSRVLFAPEIAIGTRIGERTSVEAHWVHLSHGQVFSGQNPGMDSFGVRLNYGLP